MTTPKSTKLAREEATADAAAQATAANILNTSTAVIEDGPVEVRIIECCNDFVAIIQEQIETSIEMLDASDKFKNEGMVIGVGPGVADGAGGRLTPQVIVGDSVMFGARNIVQKIESKSPPYKGKTVVIVSEKNIICKLPTKVNWVPYNA